MKWAAGWDGVLVWVKCSWYYVANTHLNYAALAKYYLPSVIILCVCTLLALEERKVRDFSLNDREVADGFSHLMEHGTRPSVCVRLFRFLSLQCGTSKPIIYFIVFLSWWQWEICIKCQWLFNPFCDNYPVAYFPSFISSLTCRWVP